MGRATSGEDRYGLEVELGSCECETRGRRRGSRKWGMGTAITGARNDLRGVAKREGVVHGEVGDK
jgi:hypothetical protein